MLNVLVPAEPFSLRTINRDSYSESSRAKDNLLKKLENVSSDAERDEIERQIAQIDAALDLFQALDAGTNHKKR